MLRQRVISAIDRDGPLHPTITAKSSINQTILCDENITLGFSSEIELSDTTDKRKLRGHRFHMVLCENKVQTYQFDENILN